MDQQNEPKTSSATAKKNVGLAVVAYIIFFLPLLTEAKNDPFVKFHVKQGLVLFISFVITWIIGTVIPVVGWILMWPLNIFLLIIWILGIINAAKGEQKPVPIIGKFGNSFKF